jgi:8-oxo-dGTP diphosphatase
MHKLVPMQPKKRRINWVPVVTALIRKENQVLIGLRPEGKNLAGQWEFPGGKVEIGETPEQALTRELREELNIEAEIGKIQLVSSHSYGETSILLLFYEVRFWKGEPKPAHHSELRWIEAHELLNLSIPEANRKLLNQIIPLLGNTSR